MSKLTSCIAVLTAPGTVAFQFESLDATRLGASDLLCETLVTAISPGTELAAYGGAPALREGVTYPRYVGYCNVARVLACGVAVQGYAVDDRVLSFASHRSHFAISAADVLATVPHGVGSEHASCAYLFQLGYNAVLSGAVRLGSTVVVLGLGVVGLCAARMAVLAGARVVGISDRAYARDTATSFGASCYGRADLQAVAAAVGTAGAHAVITTTNTWEDWRMALQLAGVRGTIVVLGFPGRSDPRPPFNPLDSKHFYARQLKVVAAGMSPERPDARGYLPFNERDNLRRILDWIADGSIVPKSIVSGEFPAKQLAAAYAALARRDGSSFTYLLRWAD